MADGGTAPGPPPPQMTRGQGEVPMNIDEWCRRQGPATEELRTTLVQGAAHPVATSQRDVSEVIEYLRRSLVVQCSDERSVRVWTGLAIIEEGAAELFDESRETHRERALGRLLVVVDDVLSDKSLPI